MSFIQGFLYLLFIAEGNAVMLYLSGVLNHTQFCYAGIFVAPVLAIVSAYQIKKQEESDKGNPH